MLGDYPGSLDFSGDVVDPATGAVALRARVPNPERRLLPGTFVTLKATDTGVVHSVKEFLNLLEGSQ